VVSSSSSSDIYDADGGGAISYGRLGTAARAASGDWPAAGTTAGSFC